MSRLWPTVVSEKLHAIALLGMTNSRLKDYLDIWVLLDREALNAHTLARAIAATFVRRGMSVPAALPAGLTDEFATDPSRQAIWPAFLKKNQLAVMPLLEVVTTLRTKLGLESFNDKLYRYLGAFGHPLFTTEKLIFPLCRKLPAV